MKDCEHEVKIKFNDIVSTKDIYRSKFKCIKCNTKVRLNVSKFFMILILLIFIAFTIPLIINPLTEILSTENFITQCGYTLLVIIGLVGIYSWITNFIIWLLRKKIKFVEIEDDE